MAIFDGLSHRVFLVLSMGEFNSKAIVLRCVRTNPNRGRKIPVSFFTKLWFPSSSKCWSTSNRRSRDGEFNGFFTWQISSTISFNCLVESFLGMVLVITEHCLLLKFVLKMAITKEGYFGRGEKNSFLMVIALQMIKFDLYTMKMLHYLSNLILTLRV